MAQSLKDFESNVEKFQIKNTLVEYIVEKKSSYCSCCLAESLALISTSNCSHYDYYKQFFDIKNLLEEQYICVICHEMLRKIKNFNNMIIESYHILANNITSVNKHTKKYVDFGISQQAGNFDVEYNDEVNDKQIKNDKLTEEAVDSLDEDNSFDDENNSFDDDNNIFDDDNIASIDKNHSKIQDGFKPIMIMPYCEAAPSTSTNSLLTLMLTSQSKIKPPVFIQPASSEATQNRWIPYIKPEFKGKVKYVYMTKEEYDKEKKCNYEKHDYKCKHCLVGFRFQKAFEAHMKDVHINPVKCDDATKEQCSICKIYVKSPLYIHEDKHFVRYECCVCQMRVTQLPAAVKHYLSKHDRANKQFKCKKCDYVATDEGNYKRHSEIHNEDLPCDQCDRVFRNKESLSAHQTLKHSNIVPEAKFECNICHKRYRTRVARRVHARNIHGDTHTSAACHTCGKTFKSNTLLHNHMSTHELKFTCHDCGHRYSTKQQLRRHILLAHLKRDLSVACPECGKRCLDKQCLKSHRRQHAARKVTEYLCQICGNKLGCPKSLLDHMNTHSGARPHACRFCSATFGHKAALYTHTRLKHYKGKRMRDMREEEI